MWLYRGLHTRCGKAAGRAGRHQHFSGFHVPGQFCVHQQLHDVAQSSRSKASCQDVRVFVNGEENDLCLAVLPWQPRCHSFLAMEDGVVGTVSDGWALLEAAARLQPDIVT